MRTALRRARRLGAFLLIAMAAWWVVRRRRSAVRWIEPPAAPDGLPPDVLATDAGLTALPDEEAPAAPAGTVVVDEVRVGELLAETPADDEPAPASVEAVVDVSVDEPTETELITPELGIDEPTMTIPRDPIAVEDEQLPMPTFSEAPTMEIPAVTDDLRAVRGIGPSMERLLHGLGIISYRQLAMLDGDELERVRSELSDFRTRIDREDWVGQARHLHKEKYGRDPA